MLQDAARTEAYRSAIMQNRALFQGAVVLDVGCGTGILSLFAAEAGAECVYAVDASDIAKTARKIVKANNLDHIITVLHSRVEDVRLDHQHVDIIISEWMGYFLLYESMLGSVLYARDKWLRPDGHMFPTSARLFLSGFTFPEYYQNNVTFWSNVYGFDMTDVLPLAKRSFLDSPQVEWLSPERDVAQQPTLIKDISLLSVSAADIAEWSSPFELKCAVDAETHGLFAWFDVGFPHADGEDKKTSSGVDGGDRLKKRKVDTSDPNANRIVLCTSPCSERTHWGQTLFYFNVPLNVKQDDVITGQLDVTEENRTTSVGIKWTHANAASKSTHGKKSFKID